MIQVLKDEFDFLIKLRGDGKTKRISDEISKPQFTVSDVSISSRILNHWDNYGLLMESYQERSWRKFNLIEYVWLMVIVELRQYDIPLKIIKEVKNSLCFEFGINDLPNKEEFNQMLTKIAKPEHKEIVSQLLMQEEIQKEMQLFRFNYLELVIQSVILLRDNFSLLVNNDGVCIPLKHACIDEYFKKEEFHEFLAKTHLSISITGILKDFLFKNEFSLPKRRLVLLDEKESKVINTIRSEDVVSVIVKKGDDKKIDMIEEFKRPKVEKASRLMDIILSHGYQTIEIKTQNGNIVSCEDRIKIKLKE